MSPGRDEGAASTAAPVVFAEPTAKQAHRQHDITQCPWHSTSAGNSVEVVHAAKTEILDEAQRIRRRRAARACVDEVLDRAEIAKKARAADPDRRRIGVLAAREHLRGLGLDSELTDSVLRDLWQAS